jgi:DNA-binding NtrC family response regulator
VILAADGAEASALFAARNDEIAVVITDMMMPVMDGPATIQVMKRIRPEIKIIGASGLNVATLTTKAAEAGAHCFIPKPFTAESLLLVIRRTLDGKPVS